MTESGKLQWSPQSNEYNVDADGIERIVGDLFSKCKKNIIERRYDEIICTVIEELEYGSVKIKLKRSGLIKKMKVSSKRIYH